MRIQTTDVRQTSDGRWYADVEAQVKREKKTVGVSGERWECPVCGDKNPRMCTSCRCGAPALPLLAKPYEPELPWKQDAELNKSHGWSPSKYQGHKAHTPWQGLSKAGNLAEVEAQIRRNFAMITRYPQKVLEGAKNDRDKNDARRALHGLPSSPSGISIAKSSSSPALPAALVEQPSNSQQQISAIQKQYQEQINRIQQQMVEASSLPMPLHRPQPSLFNEKQPDIGSYGSRKPPQINSQTHSRIPGQTHPVSLVSGGRVDPRCGSCEKLLGAVDSTMDAFVVLVEDVLSSANAGRASGGFTAETHARKGVQEILMYVAKEYENVMNLVDDGLEEAYTMVDELSLKLKVPASRRPPPMEIDLTPPAPELYRRDHFLSQMKTEAQRAFDEYQWEWWTHDEKGKFAGLESEQELKLPWWTEEQNPHTTYGMEYGLHGIHTLAQWNHQYEKDQEAVRPHLDAMDEGLDMLRYYENNWMDKSQGTRGTAPWLQPAEVVFPDEWRNDEGMEEAFRKVNKRDTAPYLFPGNVRSFEFESRGPRMTTKYEVRSGQGRTPEEVFGYKEEEYDDYLQEEGYVSPDPDNLDLEDVSAEVQEARKSLAARKTIPKFHQMDTADFDEILSRPVTNTTPSPPKRPMLRHTVVENLRANRPVPTSTKLKNAFAFGAFGGKKKAPETPEKNLPVLQRLESNLPDSGQDDEEFDPVDASMASMVDSMASTGRRRSTKNSISPGARRASVSKNAGGKVAKKPSKGIWSMGRPKKNVPADPEAQKQALGRSQTADLNKPDRPSVAFKTAPSAPNLNQFSQFEAAEGEESTDSSH